MNTKTTKLYLNKILITHLLMLMIVLLVCAYVYMINFVAFNTAARAQVFDEIALTQTKINNLEGQNVSKNKEISRDLAVEYGLTKDIQDEVLFVMRDPNTRLTFNE